MQNHNFTAMGSPCELQIDTGDAALALALGALAEAEARRIEYKYSRYLPDSVTSQINALAGFTIETDQETAGLIDYADAVWRMSGGRFDITSGALRRAWVFDGSDRLPDAGAIAAARAAVGWHKVRWQKEGRGPGLLQLAAGMEIDLGGLAKEYAVDRALAVLLAAGSPPVLVNFGGDLRVSGPRAGGERWRIRIEAVEAHDPAAWLALREGAVTTSGDARRFLLRDGRRYGHILDPRSGQPVTGAPRAVTVAAPTCLEAGILSTLAMLHGEGAERFLEEEGVKAWVTR